MTKKPKWSRFLFATTAPVSTCNMEPNFFRSFNASTGLMILKARVSDWRSFGASWNATGEKSGPRALLARARLFIFLYQKEGTKMDKLGYILLADDNENDLELETRALAQYRLANEIVIVRDGAEALDFLYRQGEFSN